MVVIGFAFVLFCFKKAHKYVMITLGIPVENNTSLI